ncbi:MAG: adenylate/guanylate cyclase domain-containing protein [Treponema sp.]|jgi:adenylate cyclase|nr:adenylate/guanylate cyclase domain-containing protein [Treponema sp.]
MSVQLPFAIKKLLYSASILALSLLAAALLFVSGVTGYWDMVLYDFAIKNRVLHSPETKNPLIATIDLNDASIELLGEALDTRQAYADILEVLGDTNTAVALDFLFRAEKTGDTAYVRAVGWAGDTVIASLAVEKDIMNLPNIPYQKLTETEQHLLSAHVWHIKVLDKGKIPEAGTFLLPFSDLIEVAGQIAHINMTPDTDGIYRRTPLLYEWEGGYIPSLGLAAAVQYLHIPVETIELKAGAFLALPLSEEEVIRIPIDEQGCMLIPYTETWSDDLRRISFNTVVQAKYDDDIFDTIYSGLAGRIALIAEISTSQKDFGPTSFERLYPLSGIHAEVLSGILDGFGDRAFIGWASMQYKALTLLLFICAALLCIQLRKDSLFNLGFFAVLLVFSGVTLFRWQFATISPWFAFPVSLLFFIWLSTLVSRLFSRYRETLLMRNALSRYFPHALAERIMSEGKTELVPAYKELTILFSDISGFTKWSSDKSPDNVHNFLSDYLESMAEILFSYGGTVDKFMGDGILSFFGDPLNMPDHAIQCVKAAIAMQEKVRFLAEKWKPLVDIDLKVRIGINTGKVIVGNLGNKTRIEYTVIGAAVNLAQRMESNAPVGGILVTAETHEKVKDKFTFTEKREVTVKGYAETIEAYVVEQITESN